MKTGTAGGVEAVVKAIETHTNNTDVCCVGCLTLYNMTTNNSKNTDKNKTITIKHKNKQLRTK